jgi:hypothetical protein
MYRTFPIVMAAAPPPGTELPAPRPAAGPDALTSRAALTVVCSILVEPRRGSTVLPRGEEFAVNYRSLRLATFLLLISGSPAFAQETPVRPPTSAPAQPVPADLEKYYVVQDLKTKECKVVNTMPLNSTTVTVVGPAFFESRKAAEDGIKNIIVCTMK